MIYLEFQHIMLEFALKFQKIADSKLPLQIRTKKVGGECRAESSLERVASSRAVPVAHTHAGLRSNDALNLYKKINWF